MINRRDLLKAGTLATFAGMLETTELRADEARTDSPQLPPAFLWGAATAAHQVEGNNVNSDCWTLEHLPDSMFKEPSGDACDHYHLYASDMALVASLGLNAYRFSIEWARIEPEEGSFSRAELEHYRRMLAECHQHGLTPFVTYSHFTTPRWFAYDGGWENPAAVDRFARYCEASTKHLGDLVSYAGTFNEPDLMMLLRWIQLPNGLRLTDTMTSAQPRVRRQLRAEMFSSFFVGNAEKMRETMLLAHTKGKSAIKSLQPAVATGLTLAMEDDQPAPSDSHAEQKQSEVYGPWLQLAKQDDFIGVQTYTRQRVGKMNLPPPQNAELTQSGYEFYPEALEQTIRYASRMTGVPVLVTENGVAAENDERRIEYITRAIAGVQRCREDKVDVRGYFYWSLLDNFEWVSGYGPKFGLVSVNRETQARTIKPSAAVYGALARKTRMG